MTVEIPLTRGKVMLVDAEDEHLFRDGRKWRVFIVGKQMYGGRLAYLTGDRRVTLLLAHRVIMGLVKGDGRLVDHKNHDTLDNRRANLRVATHSQNGANMRPRPGTSRYKGVHWSTRDRVWRASITVDRKIAPLGTFRSEEAAARAYDAAAVEAFGEFAYLNFPAEAAS